MLLAAGFVLVVSGRVRHCSRTTPWRVQRTPSRVRRCVRSDVHAGTTAFFGCAFLLLLGNLAARRHAAPGIFAVRLGLVVLLGAQVVVGETQYHTELPWGLVLVHVALAAAIWVEPWHWPGCSGVRRHRSSLRPRRLSRWTDELRISSTADARATCSGRRLSRLERRRAGSIARRRHLVKLWDGRAVRRHRPGGLLRLPGHAPKFRSSTASTRQDRVAGKRLLHAGRRRLDRGAVLLARGRAEHPLADVHRAGGRAGTRARGRARRRPSARCSRTSPTRARRRSPGAPAIPELVERLGLEASRYEGPTGIVGVLHDACRQPS